MGAVATMEEGSTCSRRGDGRLGAAARPFAAIGRSATTAGVLLVLPLLVVMLLGSTPLPSNAFGGSFRDWFRGRKVKKTAATDGPKVWLVMSLQNRRWYGGGVFNVVYKLHKDDLLPAVGYTTVRMNCPAYRLKKGDVNFKSTKRNLKKCRKAAEKFVAKKRLGHIARQTFEVEQRNAPLLYNVSRQMDGNEGQIRFKATDTAAGDLRESTTLFYTCQEPGDLDKKSSLCLGGKGIPKFFPGLESQYHKRLSTPSMDALHSHMKSLNLKVTATGDMAGSYIVHTAPQAQDATSVEAAGAQTPILSAERNEEGMDVLLPLVPAEESERAGNGNVLFIYQTNVPSPQREQQQTEGSEPLRSGGEITTRRVDAPMFPNILKAYNEEKGRIQNLTHVFLAGPLFSNLVNLAEHFEKQAGNNNVKFRYIQDESPATPEELTAPLSAALWPSYEEKPKLVYRHTRFWGKSLKGYPHSVGNYRLSVTPSTWRISDVEPKDLMPVAWPKDVTTMDLFLGESGVTVKYTIHLEEGMKSKTFRLPNFQSLTLQRVHHSSMDEVGRRKKPPSPSEPLPEFYSDMPLDKIELGFTKLSFTVEKKTKAVRSTQIFRETLEAGFALRAGGHSSNDG